MEEVQKRLKQITKSAKLFQKINNVLEELSTIIISPIGSAL